MEIIPFNLSPFALFHELDALFGVSARLNSCVNSLSVLIIPDFKAPIAVGHTSGASQANLTVMSLCIALSAGISTVSSSPGSPKVNNRSGRR